MKITADNNCFLTQVANVTLDKREFVKFVIVETPEESAKWKQISEEEKASLEAQKAIFDNQEITPEYLQKVGLLLDGIREKINDTPMSAEDSLANKEFFPEFDSIIGKEINIGYRFNCDKTLFEALVPHKVSEEHRPTLKKATRAVKLDSSTELYKVVTTD